MMNRGIVAALLGLLSVGATGIAAQVAPAFEPRTIRVSGVGEVRVEPDQGTVQFAVETTGATAQEAGQENAQVMDRVIQALVSAGVRREDIATSGYSLFPVYAGGRQPQDTDPPRIRGYRASNQVSVRTMELDRIGRYIDVGLNAGANRLHGVSFELRNSQAAQAQALQRAVEEARSAAQTIAGTLGVALGSVLDASTSAEPVRPLFRAVQRDMMVAEGAFAPTPIEPGEQTVRAVASLVFAIE